eukprot:g5642.t1
MLSGGYLNIHMPQQYGGDLQIPYSDAHTGMQVAATVAKRLRVHQAYLVLYSTALVVEHGDGGAGIDGVQTLADRDLGLRLDNSAQTLAQHAVHAGSTLTALLRPLRGDHLHNAVAIYYKGHLMSVPSDRPVLAVGNNMQRGEDHNRCTPDEAGGQYEPRKPATQAAPEAGTGDAVQSASYIGERAWEGNHVNNVYPHFGVHSGHDQWFGMGLIHIHPATSWQWFRGSEGLGANLGAFLEQVGIWAWETGSHRYPFHAPVDKARPGNVVLDFPPGSKLARPAGDGATLKSNYPGAEGKWSHCDYPTRRILVQNDDEYEWRLYYWPHVNATADKVQVLKARFDRVWLRHNLAMLVLAFERKDAPPNPILPANESVAYLRNDASFFRNTRDGETSKKIHFASMFDDLDEADRATKIPHDISGDSVLGFDGEVYPMPNAPGSRWKATPPPVMPESSDTAAVRAQAQAAGASDAAGAQGQISVNSAIGIAVAGALLASAGTYLATRTRRLGINTPRGAKLAAKHSDEEVTALVHGTHDSGSA